MRKLFTLFVAGALGILTTQLAAQSWGFAQYGNWVYDAQPAADGSVWAVGLGGDDPMWTDVTDGYVVKLDATGQKVWGHPITGLPWGYAAGRVAIPQTDGGCAIYASVDSMKAGLYKVDADGNLVWASSGIPPAAVSYFLYGGKAVQLNDGRFIIGGLTEFEHLFYVLDATGHFVSQWTLAVDPDAPFAGSYFEYRETGMKATPDGGFVYTCGSTLHRLLYKYDSDLNLEWSGTYDLILDWEYGMTSCLNITPDGGYVIGGSGTDATGIYHGTVRKIAGDGTLEWATALNHGYEWEEGCNVSPLGSDQYIAFTQDAGDESTHGWILNNAGVQVDSVKIPLISCVGGWSETGFEVWDVDPTADGGYVLSGRQWLEDCDQRFTVLKSESDGTFSDCIFSCVWPGDANNDGTDDPSDLFEVGIFYGTTGYTRSDMGIDWSAKLSKEWADPAYFFYTILDGAKYADCDGNGSINSDDTTAIVNNLTLEHPLNTLRLDADAAPLYFEPAGGSLHVGMNHVPIMLGDDITSIDAIYGLSFTVNVDGDNVDAASIKVSFAGWMGTTPETLHFSKNFGDTKQALSGIVRIDQNNTGGNGQIGTLDIVIVDNIAGKTESSDVTLSFSDVKAITLDRTPVDIAAEPVTVSVDATAVTDNQLDNMFSMYPNPASEEFYLENQSHHAVNFITISDMSGKTMMQVTPTNNSIQSIDITSLPVGNYMVTVNCAEGTINRLLTKQ